MAQPTIKKKTLKIKKAGSPSAAAQPSTQNGGTAGAGPGEEVPLTMATGAAPLVKKPSYTFSAIMGLIALLMLIGLLVMQYMEFTFLSPLFPLPPQAGI
jgi:hypothetical protein